MEWITTGLIFDLKITHKNDFLHVQIAIRHEIGPAKCSRSFKAIEMNL